MSAKAELERIIDEHIKENEKLISILEVATRPIAPDNAIGRLTRMEALGAKSINEEALRMAQDQIIKLDSARHRLSDPDFGICARCGQPINIERLLVMPESRICVPCKTK